MASLTHKGYANYDFAIANKHSQISEFPVPKLKSLEEHQQEENNPDFTKLVSPICKDPSMPDTYKLHLDLEIDLSKSHRDNRGY